MVLSPSASQLKGFRFNPEFRAARMSVWSVCSLMHVLYYSKLSLGSGSVCMPWYSNTSLTIIKHFLKRNKYDYKLNISALSCTILSFSFGKFISTTGVT